MKRGFRVWAGLVLILLLWWGSAAAHTPDWTSRLLEWAFGRKAPVGEAPSAGWLRPEPAPEFTLVDQDGKGLALRDLRGKVVLLHFTHTGCGESCASMRELRVVATALGGRIGKEVMLLSITLDPERDTQAALRAFGQRLGIGPGWKLLTGPPRVIEGLAVAYGVYVKRVENSQKNTRAIEYGDVVLLVDQQGRLRKRILPHVLQLSGRKDVEWLLESHDH